MSLQENWQTTQERDRQEAEADGAGHRRYAVARELHKLGVPEAGLLSQKEYAAARATLPATSQPGRAPSAALPRPRTSPRLSEIALTSTSASLLAGSVSATSRSVTGTAATATSSTPPWPPERAANTIPASAAKPTTETGRHAPSSR